MSERLEQQKTTRKSRWAAYYMLHRKEDNARCRHYYASHQLEIKTKKALYQASHRDQATARHRNWAANHRTSVNALQKAYTTRHPEGKLLRASLYRARKRGLLATLTIAQWNAIKKAYGFKCAYCGKKSQRLTKDHVVPLTLGGGTTPDNIVPACKSCNSAKRDRPPVRIPALRLLL